jgi:hypothetical protein
VENVGGKAGGHTGWLAGIVRLVGCGVWKRGRSLGDEALWNDGAGLSFSGSRADRRAVGMGKANCAGTTL